MTGVSAPSAGNVNAGSGDLRLIAAAPGKGQAKPYAADIGACQRVENYPAAADVESGVQYGQANEFTGTYTGGVIVVED